MTFLPTSNQGSANSAASEFNSTASVSATTDNTNANFGAKNFPNSPNFGIGMSGTQKFLQLGNVEEL